jgi:hypothetical protein
LKNVGRDPEPLTPDLVGAPGCAHSGTTQCLMLITVVCALVL